MKPVVSASLAQHTDCLPTDSAFICRCMFIEINMRNVRNNSSLQMNVSQ